MSFTYLSVVILLTVLYTIESHMLNDTVADPKEKHEHSKIQNLTVSTTPFSFKSKTHMERRISREPNRFGHRVIRKEGVTMSPTEKTGKENRTLAEEKMTPKPVRNTTTVNVTTHVEKPTQSTTERHEPVKIRNNTVIAVEGGGNISVSTHEYGNVTSGLETIGEKGTTARPEERRIHPRKGVNISDSPDHQKSDTLPSDSISSTRTPVVLSTTTTETTKLKDPYVKKKPLFTMIVNDKEITDGQSFIESSTTGKDFVFPIVLAILVFPVLLIIIKLIYKRGTEFTERQQYHRMYLIDGMYNSR